MGFLPLMAKAIDLIHPSSISPFIFLFNLFLPRVPVSVLNTIGNKYFSFWSRCAFIFKIFGMLCRGLSLINLDFFSRPSLTFFAVSRSDPRVHSKGNLPALLQTPNSLGLASAKNHLLSLYALILLGHLGVTNLSNDAGFNLKMAFFALCNFLSNAFSGRSFRNL